MKRQADSESSHSAEERKLDGLVVGCLAGFDEAGEPLVDFAGNPSPEPLSARTLCVLEAGDLGRDVALLFEGGDATRPVALGVIRAPGASRVAAARSSAARIPLEVHIDGERVEIRAEREIVIRSGHASITLSADGKVTIRGKDVLSRSTGPNRVQGGSVQLN